MTKLILKPGFLQRLQETAEYNSQGGSIMAASLAPRGGICAYLSRRARGKADMLPHYVLTITGEVDDEFREFSQEIATELGYPVFLHEYEWDWDQSHLLDRVFGPAPVA